MAERHRRSPRRSGSCRRETPRAPSRSRARVTRAARERARAPRRRHRAARPGAPRRIALALDGAARLDPADHAVAYEMGMLSRQRRGDADAALAQFERARGVASRLFARAPLRRGVLRRAREWSRRRCASRVSRPDQPTRCCISRRARARRARTTTRSARSCTRSRQSAPRRDAARLRAVLGLARQLRRAASLFTEALRAIRPMTRRCRCSSRRRAAARAAWLRLGGIRAARAAPAFEAQRRRAGHALSRAARRRRSRDGRSRRRPSRASATSSSSCAGRRALQAAAPARLRRAIARLHPLLARTGLFRHLDRSRTRRRRKGDSDPRRRPALVVRAADAFTLPPSLAIARCPRASHMARRARGRGPASLDRRHVARGHARSEARARLSKSRADRGDSSRRWRRSAGRSSRCSARARRASSKQHARARAARCTTSRDANDDLEDALALLARARSPRRREQHQHAPARRSREQRPMCSCRSRPNGAGGVEGDSPWFPGFRVHRQHPGGDWTSARRDSLGELAVRLAREREQHERDRAPREHQRERRAGTRRSRRARTPSTMRPSQWRSSTRPTSGCITIPPSITPMLAIPETVPPRRAGTDSLREREREDEAPRGARPPRRAARPAPRAAGRARRRPRPTAPSPPRARPA